MAFRGSFHPAYTPRITGFNQTAGKFFIGFISDDDISYGQIAIELTVSAAHAPSKGNYASLHVHYDGIKVIRELEEIGFLAMFEEIEASTFYDIVQCCARCGIPIAYPGGDDYNELTPRKIYEMLYA